MVNSARDTIQHITVHWRGSPREAHASTVSLQAERLLNRVDWHPAGMRPGAVLLIRHLRGLPPLRTSSVLPAGWETALHGRINELYRHAVRPIGGRIPANAESILFDDPAELVICLTLQTLERPSQAAMPEDNWYWEQIGGNKTIVPALPGARLALLWCLYPAALPKALAALPARQVFQAAALLTPAEIHRVIAAISATFALPTFTATVSSSAKIDIRPAIIDEPVISAPSPAAVPLAFFPLSPWSRWLPDLPMMARPAELLLGLCAVLICAPTVVRSASFAEQVSTWWESPIQPEHKLAHPALAALETTLELAQPLPPAIAAPDLMLDLPEAADTTFAQHPPLHTDGVPTALSGMLYLIHLLGWLDLPAIWDVGLSGWAVIEGLARGLLGMEAEIHADDALWSILAALDGRSPENLLGAEVAQTDVFRLPALWLHRINQPHFPVAVMIHERRLWLVNPDAGFILVDVALAGREPDEVAQTEIAAYAQEGIVLNIVEAAFDPKPYLTPLTPSSAQIMTPAAQDWIEHTTGFFRWLLSELLAGDRLAPETLITQMFYKPGWLTVSSTHIDLYLSMAQADIQLRRTGLDRDPGWMPDLGYIILFHFIED